MKKLIEIILKLMFLPATQSFLEIDAETPNHCGQDSEFIGNHTSLGGELFFYRCPVCSMEFTRRNTHKGISLSQMWRLVFMPKIPTHKKESEGE